MLPHTKKMSAVGITIKESEKPSGAQYNFLPDLVLVDGEGM